MSAAPDDALGPRPAPPAQDSYETNVNPPKDGAPPPEETHYNVNTPAHTPTKPPSSTGSSAEHFPKIFGKYRLLRKIDKGGMGVVYEAEELGPDPKAPGSLKAHRRVALKKILRERIEIEKVIERFHGEMESGKRLEGHAGIVTVFDSGEVDGEYFFTMPFISGGSLQQFVKSKDEDKNAVPKQLTPRQAARMVLQVAEAVDFAHGKGIIHRDIKPPNILLSSVPITRINNSIDDSQLDIQPKLADFGLALIASDDGAPRPTLVGQPLGTAQYMPPEQARGDLDKICPASDVYGLGAVLYALLTRVPPFPLQKSTQPGADRAAATPIQETLQETLRQVEVEEPIAPRKKNSQIPRELESICLQCLEKKPERRYASCRQLIEALDDFLTGQPLIRHTRRRPNWLMRAMAKLGHNAWKHPVASGSAVLGKSALMALAYIGYATLSEANRVRRERISSEARLWEEAQAEAKEASDTWNNREKPDPSAAHELYRKAQTNYDELLRTGTIELKLFDVRLAHADVLIQLGILSARNANTRPKAAEEFKSAQKELKDLREEAPENRECLQKLAEVDHRLGSLYFDDLQWANSLAMYQEAEPLRKQLHDADPLNQAYLRDLARHYAYKGDCQRELGDISGATKSYEDAKKWRTELFELVRSKKSIDERIEAICLHARDFGNFANLEERQGRSAGALDLHRKRLKFYDENVPHDQLLRGEYRSERADCLLSFVDLHLNFKKPDSESRAWLDRACEEYARFPVPTGDNVDWPLKQGLAQCNLLRGKHLALEGKPEQARPYLETAIKGLDDIVHPSRKSDPDDWYYRAVAHAMYALVIQKPTEASIHSRWAINDLTDAVNRRFSPNQAFRLEREIAFKKWLDDQDKKSFEDLVKDLRAKQTTAH